MDNRQSKQHNNFIFEDHQSSFICCRDNDVTTQCSKIPRRVRRVDESSRAVDQRKKVLDEHLASTIKGLSVKERNAALEEVNGIVDNDLENSMEDPAVLDQKLIEMDEHLHKIKSGSVYEQAESMDPDYVQKQEFRVMFLRSQRYDPNKAARHVLGYFDTKLWLFGHEKLCKDITLDDLSKKERQLVRRGYAQFLSRDVGGRMICTFLRGMFKDTDILTECRAHYYTLMALVESDEETQKKGIIALVYMVGDYYRDKNAGRGLDKIGRLAPSLPIHWAGFHFCCDDIVQYVFLRGVVLTFPKHLAAKFRRHKGTHLECMYALRTYGIPASAVPIPETGEGDKPPLLYQHTIWYHNRERLEKQGNTTTANIIPNDDDDSSLEDPILEEIADPFTENVQARLPTAPREGGAVSLVATSGSQSRASENLSLGPVSNNAITPRRSDVLFGSQYRSHPGTLQLHQVVSQQLPVFESITHRAEKVKFVGLLFQHMKASGVRFLAMDKATNRWVEVEDKAARNKVSKAFRNKRRTTGTGPSIFQS